jgi:integrase
MDERPQCAALLHGIREPMMPVVTFAYVTGWRINSEVLPLQWRQVDLKAGEVRLDPGTTKNMEGRVFYLTAELKKLLTDQRKAANRVQRQKGMIVQHVFFHDGTTKAGDVAFLAGHAISPSGFHHACAAPGSRRGARARLPTHSDPEHGSRRRAGTRGHEAERPQDTQRVRPVQHCQRRATCAMRPAASRTIRRPACP